MSRKDLAGELSVERLVSVEIKSVSSEALAVPAGAAGSVVVAQLAKFPVRNSSGNDIGGFGDTSLVLTSSTAFTTEVYGKKADADLANGEYWVDYIRGEVRGKKASTSTSATAAYKIASKISVVSPSQADGDTNASNPLLIGAEAQDPTALPTATTAGKIVRLLTDFSRRLIVTLGTKIAGENITKDRMTVEESWVSSGVLTGDTLVLNGAGQIGYAIFTCNDAAPTAGSVIIYNNTAGSGTQVLNHTFTTTPFVPFVVPLHQAIGTGIYVDFTTTNDVNVVILYRS